MTNTPAGPRSRSRRGALAALLGALVFPPFVPAARAQDPYPPAPAGVVEAFCAADFEGAQTDSDTWPRLARYATWPDAPGWDTFTIVTAYRVSPLSRTARAARVRVVYDVAGVLAGEEARAEPRTETHVFRLVRRGGRWTIAAPQLRPHVSAATALRLVERLERNELVPADPAKIRASKEVVRRILAAP
jgi:hypothetical protein